MTDKLRDALIAHEKEVVDMVLSCQDRPNIVYDTSTDVLKSREAFLNKNVPPEPTEEIYKAAYDAWWDWLNAGRGSGFESVKVAVRAALLAAQK
ncbi:hypothetical protein LCGC14_1375570 [marine sediment metagenome]|uniref:Uncharacterized protein n=1 Tax=marine sediment metagenome TaxID=412755 RepID=A0A0F9K470_9ZZZZ